MRIEMEIKMDGERMKKRCGMHALGCRPRLLYAHQKRPHSS